MENITETSNKDRFRVYLRHHLKEVAISPNPHLNFLQIA